MLLLDDSHHIDQGQPLGSSCSKQGAPLRCWLSAQQGEPKGKKLRGKHAKQKNRWPKITRLESYQWKSRLEFLCEKQLFFFPGGCSAGAGVSDCLISFLESLGGARFPRLSAEVGVSHFKHWVINFPQNSPITAFCSSFQNCCCFFVEKDSQIVLSRFRNPRKTSCYYIS